MTEQRYFAPMQLLLGCDYLADPLWDVRGANIGVDDVPISEATREALRDWARRWDRLAKHDLEAEDIEAGMMEGQEHEMDRRERPRAQPRGRAVGMRHIPSRDEASAEDIVRRDWKRRWRPSGVTPSRSLVAPPYETVVPVP